MNLASIHKIHMLGIGGIGMSALARYFHAQGKLVSGYDRTETVITQGLAELGIQVQYDPDPGAVGGADLLVYTPAVPGDHPEFEAARSLGIPQIKRAKALGLISESRKTIAVAGTHGKTSTSGLITHLLHVGGVAVTGFVGGIVKNFDSNYIEGDSDWIVAEADEFDRSFLNLYPDIAVITSLDADHLDIYGSPDDLVETYQAFADQVKAGGTVFVAEEASAPLHGALLSYGIGKGNIRAENLRFEGLNSHFDYRSVEANLEGLILPLPGHYNVLNALAAISVALKMGVTEAGIRAGLASFGGIRRRFEILYRSEEVFYVDDYAHHPEEIQSLLSAVRAWLPDIPVVMAFQPHLFSRTRDFLDGFAEVLSAVDALILLEIYPAREAPIPGISSQALLDRIEGPRKVLSQLDALPATLDGFRVKPGVVLTVGAGNIDTQREPVAELVKTW